MKFSCRNEGGSAQYVRLGPKQLLIENVGNPLLSVPYYRVAHLAFMRRAFGTLGVQIVNAKITSYRAASATVEVLLAWA